MKCFAYLFFATVLGFALLPFTMARVNEADPDPITEVANLPSTEAGACSEECSCGDLASCQCCSGKSVACLENGEDCEAEGDVVDLPGPFEVKAVHVRAD